MQQIQITDHPLVSIRRNNATGSAALPSCFMMQTLEARRELPSHLTDRSSGRGRSEHNKSQRDTKTLDICTEGAIFKTIRTHCIYIYLMESRFTSLIRINFVSSDLL